MKIYVYLFIIIFSLSIPIKAGELKEKSVIPYRVWDSDTCNIGQAEVWFQNWVDYTRLFIKSIKDTSIINKHPYAKTDFKKSYLNAKDFTKLNYVQLLGNIKWFENQNWNNVMKETEKNELISLAKKYFYKIDGKTSDRFWKFINTLPKLTNNVC